MNLLLVEPGEISDDGRIELEGVRARHLREVLKVSPGSVVRAGCVDGPLGSARVEAIEGERVRLVIRLDGPTPPRPPVDLLMALPRPKVLRRLWPQLAALGVGTIVLTNAERVERFYFDSHVVRDAREHLLEGLAQAKDTRLPVVRVTKRLKPLVEDELDTIFGDARRLIADPVYERSPFDAVRARRQRVVLALGPEGGWSAYERDLLERHGFAGVGLGPRTLRSDTAAIALVALVHEALRGA
jgi:RsmE family RNA methyltransferase